MIILKGCLMHRLDDVGQDDYMVYLVKNSNIIDSFRADKKRMSRYFLSDF